MTRPQLTIALFEDREDGLVLMDDLITAMLLFLRMEPADVDVRSIRDHREAERIAATGECHLVLTDLMWPVAGGNGGPEWREGLNIAEVAKTANQRTVVVVITSKSAGSTGRCNGSVRVTG